MKPLPNGGAPPLISVTLGDGATQKVWKEVRSYDWAGLQALLTDHQPGAKDGSCLTPATFSGQSRRNQDAVRIGVIMLDSDSGAPLAEIQAAMVARGWCAAIASTHSHLGTQTRSKRGAYETWCAQHDLDPCGTETPTRFLTAGRHMRPEIAAGASIVGQDEAVVTFSHQPCPRFRVTLPLARPWVAEAFNTSKEGIDAWRRAYEATAAALRMEYDRSCADPARLFYLPRFPEHGPAPETAVLEEEWVDIFALPWAERETSHKPKAEPGNGRRRRRKGQQDEQSEEAANPAFGLSAKIGFSDPDTGETIDLRRWAARSGKYFLLASALRARAPSVLRDRLADGRRQHILCPNGEAHTSPDADFATFVCDAGDGDGAKGFVAHCMHSHCKGHDRLMLLQEMLQKRWLRIEDLRDPAHRLNEPPERPLIRVVAGKLPDVVQQAESALLSADLNIYQRGTFIVRPGVIRLGVGDAVERNSLQILEMGDQALSEALTTAANWERYDKREEQWVTIDAPIRVATIMRQREGLWRLPVLTGILSAPTLRPDGSILEEEGYDAPTGLILNTGKVAFRRIPDRPGQQEAERALEVLRELIAAFPFVNDASRSVAISGLLTAPIRRSLLTAPLHGYTAPIAGSGKSMLVDLASIIATGRVAGVIAQGKTEEELEKRLGAMLLAGQQVIAVDNCEAPLGGEFLCQLLTQQTVRCRILGRSEAPELPSNSFVTATGNNLTVIGDMTRRTIMCQLDPDVERPELRQFERDPLAQAQAGRAEYLVAALTILRAYQVAGRPYDTPSFGSFETWSSWVRGALLWLGQTDPVDTVDVVRAQDPRLDISTAILSQWNFHLATKTVTVREIIECATEQLTVSNGSSHYPKPEFARPDFREALLVAAGDGGVINSRRLGSWIGRNHGRRMGGLRIGRAPLLHGQQQWKLERDCDPA